MKKTSGKTHGYAKCQDCEWESPNWKNAQATAAVHAKTHKHLVLGDVGFSYTYDGRTS